MLIKMSIKNFFFGGYWHNKEALGTLRCTPQGGADS